MGTLEGKVAFITGAARGQGRSHAVGLAAQGADIIAVDICHPVAGINYPLADPADLAETVRQVEALGRRIIATQADVRRRDELAAVMATGLSEFGRVDIVIANAGVAPIGDDVDDPWSAIVDTNLTGVWNTVDVAKQPLIDGGRGGSIILTSSTAGLKGSLWGSAGSVAYVASKHGVIGIMRAMANELAPHSIRVNTVNPTGVNTPMIHNEVTLAYIAAHAEVAGTAMQNALPVDAIEAQDVTEAILWLVADSGRFVTGVVLPVDAGFTVR